MITEERRAKNRQWYLTHLEYAKAASKKVHAANPEYRKNYNKKWRKTHKVNFRKYHLKSWFGLSMEQYDELFANQLGKCALCGVHQDSLKRRLAVDHCWKTGEIRGLLCSHCNTGIGLLKESPEIIEKALVYLKNKTRFCVNLEKSLKR